MANSYLQYCSKDYNSIYKDLTNAISGISDTWTSREDGDPGIVLVKLMSALGDMLSYNMDRQALEYYAPTVTQRKNASKLFDLIGYRMHWYKSAKTLVTLKNTAIIPVQLNYYNLYTEADTEQKTHLYETYQLTYPATQNPPEYVDETSWYTLITQMYQTWAAQNVINIHRFLDDPQKTLITGSKGSNNLYYTIEPTITNPGEVSGTLTYNATEIIQPGQEISFNAIQGYLCSVNFNESQMKDNKYYFPESTVDESYIYVKCISSGNTETVTYFTKVDNLLLQSDGKLHFEFKVDDFDCPYIELSSYWRDDYGDNSVNFTLTYIRTTGKYGNVTKNYLDYVSGISTKTLTLTHPENSSYLQNAEGTTICSPGYNPQGAHEAYTESLNYVMTFDTIVTIYDFERFTKRQNGVSNTYAVDGQRAMDINNQLLESCNNLSVLQLQKLLNSTQTNKSTLVSSLYNRKAVHYNFYETNEPYTKYKNYGLNIHVIYGNFDTTNSLGTVIAKYSREGWQNPLNPSQINNFPYYLYCINNSDLQDDLSIQNELNTALNKCRIVNVKPEYTVVRVFPWRCCGTIHLTKPVTTEVAQKILLTVINNLSNAFHPKNLNFGEKITYMNVIEIINSSSDLIRYFDAGMGSSKLIDFEDITTDKTIESYFNNYSMMRYVQSYTENETEILPDSSLNPYYHQLIIDPEYVLSGGY